MNVEKILDADLPRIASALERIAEGLENTNDAIQQGNRIAALGNKISLPVSVDPITAMEEILSDLGYVVSRP